MFLWWFTLFVCVFSVFSVDGREIKRFQKDDLKGNGRDHRTLDIINGNITSVTKYPFIVSILWAGHYSGAGVILNERWVLTTAFNVFLDMGYLLFRVGSNKYYQGGQYFMKYEVFSHPNYNGSWDWNIALVKLDRPIKFNKKVQPIKLGIKELAADTKTTILGWGGASVNYTISLVLLEGTVTVYDKKKCAKKYPNDWTTRFICTFDKDVAPYEHDTGDPIVVDDAVYGLYAGGNGCEGNPQLYTNIPLYYKWIQDTIKSN